jgi:5-methylcytosine-specific restriction endonuclease McrA
MLENVKCEVLNASYEPLSITSARRALVLFIKGKAEIVQEHDTLIIVTGVDIYPVPVQIRLFKMVQGRNTARVPAILTQKNLFIRDGNCCQYCGRHKTELRTAEFMTRDHIVPKAKGGMDVWTNVVTACSKCNNKKADHRLEDTGMVILKPPKVPTIFEIIARTNKTRRNHNGRYN